MRLKRLTPSALTFVLLFGQAVSLGAQPASLSRVTLDLDFESAVAVARLFELDSVSDAELDRVFLLPGVQALFRQVRRFDDEATEALFKSTLRAALDGGTLARDPFQFQAVRERLDEVGSIIAWIEMNHETLAADLGRRIAEYSPSETALDVPVYLVVGGSSDGWARDGVFHVALHYFRGDLEGLKLLMAHELFHVAQNEFMTGPTVPEERVALRNVELLLMNTISEGTASLLWWPADGIEGGMYVDGVLRAKHDQNRRRVQNIFALFDLMLLRAYTDPDFDLGSVYDLGFSGRWDSPLYYLGYRIARSIEDHRGRGALRELLALPAVEFFQTYVALYRERPDDRTLPHFGAKVEEALAELAGL